MLWFKTQNSYVLNPLYISNLRKIINTVLRFIWHNNCVNLCWPFKPQCATVFSFFQFVHWLGTWAAAAAVRPFFLLSLIILSHYLAARVARLPDLGYLISHCPPGLQKWVAREREMDEARSYLPPSLFLLQLAAADCASYPHQQKWEIQTLLTLCIL